MVFVHELILRLRPAPLALILAVFGLVWISPSSAGEPKKEERPVAGEEDSGLGCGTREGDRLCICGRVYRVNPKKPDDLVVRGIAVVDLLDPQATAVTNSKGEYSICVGSAWQADLLVKSPGFVDLVLSVEPRVNHLPRHDVVHRLISVELYEELHEFASASSSPSRGALFVGITDREGRHLDGVVTVQGAVGPAVALDEDLRLSNKTSPSTPFIAWLGQSPGEYSIQVTAAGGRTCVGRTSLTVRPGAIAATVLVCD